MPSALNTTVDRLPYSWSSAHNPLPHVDRHLFFPPQPCTACDSCTRMWVPWCWVRSSAGSFAWKPIRALCIQMSNCSLGLNHFKWPTIRISPLLLLSFTYTPTLLDCKTAGGKAEECRSVGFLSPMRKTPDNRMPLTFNSYLWISRNEYLGPQRIPFTLRQKGHRRLPQLALCYIWIPSQASVI